jgi:hypothetical protein
MRRRAKILLAAVVGVALLGAGIVIGVLLGDDSDQSAHPPATTSTSLAAATTTTAASAEFGYQPLYPFRTIAEAQAWQRRHATSGDEPWHLDHNQTALRFTMTYLGFSEIDRVVDSRIANDGAHVAVGYVNPDGRTATAAVIHLARYGSANDAPWEVVGTDDTDLSLATPTYGARVTSPLPVGGQITGVDESLQVKVLQPSSTRPLGTACCVPAGGTKSPWSATVSFSGAFDPALTIVVSTGGHVQSVERFAVTGVRPA